jgi:hypothetical protein
MKQTNFNQLTKSTRATIEAFIGDRYGMPIADVNFAICLADSLEVLADEVTPLSQPPFTAGSVRQNKIRAKILAVANELKTRTYKP